MSKLRLSLILAVSIIILAGVYSIVILERQNILDWLSLLNYKPPQEIAAVANEDEMLPYTKRVFYVNKPQIDSKQVFAKYCPNSSEQTVVLGCYHSGQNGIFILSVNNSKLSGIEQVTAAYETLHAIYQRLDGSEQTQLNTELLNFEHSGLNSLVVKQQIASFEKTEPTQVLNEMTSLFGTEVQSLPPSLNSFYAKYFSNRQVIVNLYDSYEAAFTSRESLINADDQQLSSINSLINSEELSLKDRMSSLNDQQSTLDQEKAAGQINLYNQNAGVYNQNVDQYNSLVEKVKVQVDEYNAIVSQRNSIALEEQQLYQAITSPEQPISSN